MRRAGRGSEARHWLQGKSHQLSAGQRAGGGAGLGQRVFELGQIVLAGMKFQIRQQFALRLGKFFGGAGHELHSQARGGRSQRIALGGDVFGFDESLLFERPQHSRGLVHLLREIRRREGPAVEHAQDRRRGIFLLSSGEVQLAGGVATGRRQRVDAPAPDVGRQGRHRAQGFAQRGAIVGGNPAAEIQKAFVEGRLFVQQAQRFLRRDRPEPGCGSPGPRRSACAIRTEPAPGSRAERAGAGFREAYR